MFLYALNFCRSALFTLGYALLTTCYGAISLPLRLLPDLWCHRIVISWTHLVLLWVRICCGIRWRVIGAEHLATIDKPVVVLSKHQSAWETFYLQGLFWPSSTVLKKELLKIPFFGWGLAALKPIAIDRSNPRESLKQIKEQGIERLAQGYSLILFPEGTRVPMGNRVKYARSGTDIAKASGKTIVPICHDAGRFWGEGKQFVKRSGCITVVIGKPIATEGIDTKVVTQEVENWIEDTLEKIVNQQI